jgi:hypothetical protein
MEYAARDGPRRRTRSPPTVPGSVQDTTDVPQSRIATPPQVVPTILAVIGWAIAVTLAIALIVAETHHCGPIDSYLRIKDGTIDVHPDITTICLDSCDGVTNAPKGVRLYIGGTVYLRLGNTTLAQTATGDIVATRSGAHLWTVIPATGSILLGGGDTQDSAEDRDSVLAMPPGSVFVMGEPVGTVINEVWMVLRRYYLDGIHPFYFVQHLRLSYRGWLHASAGNRRTIFFPQTNDVAAIINAPAPEFIVANRHVDLVVGGSTIFAEVFKVASMSCLNTDIGPYALSSRALVMRSYLYGMHCGAYGSPADYSVTEISDTCQSVVPWRTSLPAVIKAAMPGVPPGTIDGYFQGATMFFQVNTDACTLTTDPVQVPQSVTFQFFETPDCAAGSAGNWQIEVPLRRACGESFHLLCSTYPDVS